MALLMALALELPWQMKKGARTPRRSAPRRLPDPTSFQAAQRRRNQQAAQLRQETALEDSALHHRQDRRRQPFGKFQDHIAHEAVADDHIDRSFVDVPAFHVANEMDQFSRFRSGYVARASSFPFVSSSPMFSRPTRGFRMPSISSA